MGLIVTSCSRNSRDFAGLWKNGWVFVGNVARQKLQVSIPTTKNISYWGSNSMQDHKDVHNCMKLSTLKYVLFGEVQIQSQVLVSTKKKLVKC